MSFHEVRFPTNISYNSRGGPGFNTQIIEVDSGAEERVARWAAPRRRYNARYGVKTYADLSNLIAFYIAVQGPAIGFRFKDFLDFTTASDHRSPPAFGNTVIGTGNGSTTQFQITKVYTNGVVNRTRNITKPVAGSVVVGLNGVNQASGWTVNTTTGVITFSVAPSGGSTVTAGCEFDVPVRFGSELDNVLSLTIEDFSSGGIDDIPLVELVDEGLIQDEYFFGGARAITSASSISVTPQDGRVQAINMTAASQSVTLPDPASLPLGGPYFYMINSGANSWTLRNSAAVSIRVAAVADAFSVWLGLNSSSQKVWYAT